MKVLLVASPVFDGRGTPLPGLKMKGPTFRHRNG